MMLRFSLSDAAVGRFALASGKVPNPIYDADIMGLRLDDTILASLNEYATIDPVAPWPTYNLVYNRAEDGSEYRYFVADDIPSTIQDWNMLLSSYIAGCQRENTSSSDERETQMRRIAHYRNLLTLNGELFYNQCRMGVAPPHLPVLLQSASDEASLLYAVVRERYIALAGRFDSERRAAHRAKVLELEASAVEVTGTSTAATQKDARDRADEAQWIHAIGSYRLKTLLREDYDYTRLYVAERAKLELPGYLADFDSLLDYSFDLATFTLDDTPPYIPSEAALKEAERVGQVRECL